MASALAAPAMMTARVIEGPGSLAERAQSGDTTAFAELYRANVGRVYALCLRLCGDGELARLLTQDVFVRAWEKLDTFRGESAFATWLHRLAVNLVLGDRRMRLRRLAREEAADAPSDAADPHVAAEAGMDLERAIARLPPGARAVLVLFEIEGYPHEEIADAMGVSVGTSKAQLHRARALLRKLLA